MIAALMIASHVIIPAPAPVYVPEPVAVMTEVYTPKVEVKVEAPKPAPAPVAAPVVEAPAPAPACSGDLILVEDGSCVAPDFFDDMPADFVPDLTFGQAPCPTEDAAGPCYWDAAVQGNGQGQSFFVSADGTVTYWNE